MSDFKNFRAINKMSQKDAATYFDCTQGFISQIENGIRPIPDDFISKILADDSLKGKDLFSEYIDIRDEYKNYRLIPLLNLDAVGGNINEEVDTPEYYVDYIPFLSAREDDIAIPITNDSMYPAYPPGAIVQIRKVELWREYIEFGQVYVIGLKDGRRLIKKIRKGIDTQHYTLTSFNPEYDDTSIDIDMISYIWLVIAKYEKSVM